MGKEVEVRREQGLLVQSVPGLEAKNREFGDRLFSTFGRERTLIFPISLLSKGYVAEEFLVITADGPKVIQVDTGNIGFANGTAIGDLIKERLGKEPSFFSGTAYKRNFHSGILHIGRLWIERSGTTRFFSDTQYDRECRLVEVNVNKAEQILQVNIERVRKIQAASQKISSVLSKTS